MGMRFSISAVRPFSSRFPFRNSVLVAGFLLAAVFSVIVLRSFGGHSTATLGVNDRCTNLSGNPPPGGVQLYHPYQMPHDVTLYNTCTTEENCPSCTVSQCARCYVEEYVCGGISAGSYFKNTTECNLCENGVCTEAATSSFASEGAGPELRPTIEIAERTGEVYCNAPYGTKCYDLVWTIANVGRTEEYVSSFNISTSPGLRFFETVTNCNRMGDDNVECPFPGGQGKHFPAGYSETWRFPIVADEPPATCPNSIATYYAASALYAGFNGVSYLQIPCTESASSSSSDGILHGCVDPDGSDFYRKVRTEIYFDGVPDPIKGRTDSCNGDRAIDYYCDSPIQNMMFGPSQQQHLCPYGCVNGACQWGPNVCQNGVIPVQSRPQFITAVGSKVYVLNFVSRSISVINTATNTVSATIPMGSRIDAIAAVGSKVFVANSGNSTVSVINAAIDTVMTAIPMSPYPTGFVVVGTKLYVLQGGEPVISVINTVTNTVQSTIQVGDFTYDLAAVGTYVYAANENLVISVINTATNTVQTTIPMSARPNTLIAAGSKLYVTHWDTGIVSVINTATNTVEATIPVGTNPRSLAVAGTKVYVANVSSNNVSVIDTNTNTVLATIPVGMRPYALAVSGTKVYAVGGTAVTVIDTNTNTVLATIAAGANLEAIAVSGTKVYVAGNHVDGRVFVVDTLTDTLSCSAATAVSSSSASQCPTPPPPPAGCALICTNGNPCPLCHVQCPSSSSSSRSSSASAIPAGSSSSAVASSAGPSSVSSAAQTSQSSSSSQAVSSVGALCGNRVIETGEQCDDGNVVPGDGCGQICQREAGWVCSGVPSVCTTVCGDGIRAGVEQCDDANLNNGDGCSRTCQTEQGVSSTASSQPIAVISSSAASGAPTCGNGQREGSEQCEADAECTAGTICRSCRCIAPTQRCGNGTVEAPEQCDSGHPCPDGGFCTATCSCVPRSSTSARSSAPSPSCGNGTLNDSEECEINAPCPIPGSVCVNCVCRPPAASCGNGLIEDQEECEFGYSCSDQGICQDCRCGPGAETTALLQASSSVTAPAPAPLTLPQICGNALLEGSEQCETNAACPRPGDLCVDCQCHNPPQARCGNTQLELSEECDDGNTQDGDGCSGLCQRETINLIASQAICGNGLIERDEECDDGNTVSEDGCSAVCQREVLPPRLELTLLPEQPASSSVAFQPVSSAPAVTVPVRTGPTPKRAVSSVPAFFPAAPVPSALAPSILATTIVQPPSWQPYASVVPYAPPTGPVGATGPASVAAMAAGAAAGWAWMRRRKNRR